MDWNDIVSSFPSAEEISKASDEEYSLALFEDELRSILRLILWSKSQHLDYVNVSSLSKMAEEFLNDKKYLINRMADGTTFVYWN